MEHNSRSVAAAYGIIFCAGIAVISFLTWTIFKPISALMWAFIYSIIIANVTNLPGKLMRGINFCSGTLLRIVIASLGIVTSALIWFQVGLGVFNALMIIFFSYFFALWLGKRLGLKDTLVTLIGLGTSICGASAIAATGPAIKAKEEEIGLAVACITLFGLIAMFTYPFLYTNTIVGELLRHNLNAYSIWVGSGVHETAQVIAAAGALDPNAVGPALIVKSVRIFMIGPMILVATYIMNKRGSKSTYENVTTKIILPTYGVAFIVNSFVCAVLDANTSQLAMTGFDWLAIKSVLSATIIPFLLATTFAGVGSKVKFRAIAKLGPRPFIMGAFMAVLAGVIALLLAIAVAPFI
jgi:uncharacterized integral membrane protein (TIGR00698 family)